MSKITATSSLVRKAGKLSPRDRSRNAKIRRLREEKRSGQYKKALKKQSGVDIDDMYKPTKRKKVAAKPAAKPAASAAMVPVPRPTTPIRSPDAVPAAGVAASRRGCCAMARPTPLAYP